MDQRNRVDICSKFYGYAKRIQCMGYHTVYSRLDFLEPAILSVTSMICQVTNGSVVNDVITISGDLYEQLWADCKVWQ